MRVLQLIDSLRPGGAERMAVNIANALLPHVEKSFLCCTRKEGLLKESIKPGVEYLFLDKKRSLDMQAILRLRRYIKENRIDLVHAHSTSFFIAGLLKMTGGDFKLVWHDHYGESEFLEKRKLRILKLFSHFFKGIISVNTDLKKWAIENLKCDKVTEIKNFIPETDGHTVSDLQLKGSPDDYKIICVANLRPQKDHLNLINAFELLDPAQIVSLHLIGEDPGTTYSAAILQRINNSPVKQYIYYYGSLSEITPLLRQADLGVLSSRSEGLPVALLEYGNAGVPVVCTNVGKCAEVVAEKGKVVEANDPAALAEEIFFYIKNTEQAKWDAANFQKVVKNYYSEEAAMKKMLDFYGILGLRNKQ